MYLLLAVISSILYVKLQVNSVKNGFREMYEVPTKILMQVY